MRRRRKIEDYWYLATNLVWVEELRHPYRDYAHGYPGSEDRSIRFATEAAALTALEQYAQRPIDAEALMGLLYREECMCHGERAADWSAFGVLIPWDGDLDYAAYAGRVEGVAPMAKVHRVRRVVHGTARVERDAHSVGVVADLEEAIWATWEARVSQLVDGVMLHGKTQATAVLTGWRPIPQCPSMSMEPTHHVQEITTYAEAS